MESTSIPAARSSSHVLPALLVAAARCVGVREFVDEHQRRAPGAAPRRHRVRRTSVPGSRSAWAGSARGRRAARRCCARPWVSTTAATTSRAALPAAVRLTEHRVGLADARRGAEIDAQFTAPARPAPHRFRALIRHPVAVHRSGQSESQVQFEDVDPLLTEEAELPSVGVLATSFRTRSAEPLAAATRGHLQRRVGGVMCGSMPLPLPVTASAGPTGRRARSRGSARAGRWSSPRRTGRIRPSTPWYELAHWTGASRARFVDAHHPRRVSRRRRRGRAGPITESTAPTPSRVQNGREPSTPSQRADVLAARADLGEQARWKPAVSGRPCRARVGGVSTILSGPRLPARGGESRRSRRRRPRAGSGSTRQRRAVGIGERLADQRAADRPAVGLDQSSRSPCRAGRAVCATAQTPSG